MVQWSSSAQNASPWLRPALLAVALLAALAALVALAPGASAWTGGPDGCNYEGSDTASGGVAYDFTDISAVGTSLPHDYDSAIDVTIPFNFDFCGQAYNVIKTSANGYVCFGTWAINCDRGAYPWGWPGPIPAQDAPYPAVFGYFSDLNPADCFGGAGGDTCSHWAVLGTAPDRVFIYQQTLTPMGWTGQCFWFCVYPPGSVTYQIKLFETSNCIEVHYRDVSDPDPSGWNRGVGGIQENWAWGMSYFDQSSPAPSMSNTAVRYCQAGPTPPPPPCPGPPNDCFSTPAATGAGLPYVATQDTFGATMEPGEPQPCGWSMGASVWYTYTATQSGTMQVDTYGSNFPAGVAVYTGNTLAGLANLACDAQWNGSSVTFACTAGTTYRIQVSGMYNSQGSARLQVYPCGPAPACPYPINNCFADAKVVTAVPYLDLQTNGGATLEAGEPQQCGWEDRTIWYSWTPTTSGVATVDTSGSTFWSMVGVYEGNSLGSLTPLGCATNCCSGNAVTFPCEAGKEYRIQVSGTWWWMGLASVSISPCAPPPPPACGYTVGPTAYDFTDIDPDPSVGGGGTGLPWHWTGTMTAVHPAAPEPFVFNLCGRDYQTFWLNSAGYICLDPGVTPTGTISWFVWPPPFPQGCDWWWNVGQLPDGSLVPNAAVYGYWTFVNPGDCNVNGNWGSEYCNFWKVEGTAPERVLIYEFKNVPYDWSASAPFQTFEIKLFEATDCMEVHYQSVTSPSSAQWWWSWLGVSAGFESGGAAAQGWSYDWAPPGSAGPGLSRAGQAWRACPFGAGDDAYTLNEDQPATFDVLRNDNGAGNPIAITGHTSPSKGTLGGPVGGNFTYTPNPNAVGTDTFEYGIAGGDMAATGKVTIELAPVNDEPEFAAAPGPLVGSPVFGVQDYTGWATGLRPGPAAAADEADQGITFTLASNDNPGLFAVPPTVVRAATAGSRMPVEPPVTGAFGALRIVPSGAFGRANLCFLAVDDGGTGTTWTAGLGSEQSATGDDTSVPHCVLVIENGPPVAYFDAGAERFAPGQGVPFDSCPAAPPYCSHDPDGEIASYFWEFGDGATAAQPSPIHAFSRPGAYVVRLTVTDGMGLTGTMVRTVFVGWPDGAPVEDEAAGADPAPMADAGGDVTALEGSTVRLAGLARGRDTALYAWSQAGGPAVALSDPTAASPAFTAPWLPDGRPVALVFALKVTDGALASLPDHVTVTVRPRGDGLQADAGSTVLATVGLPVSLLGSATGGAGAGLAYSWIQVEGPRVQVSGADQALATFTAPDQPAVLSFRLLVTDGTASSEDVAVVYVQPAEAPTPGMHVTVTPAADGADATFTAVAAPGAAWDFGDGSPPATGDRVVHHYAPGTYRATLRAGDWAGVRDIEVAAPKARPATAEAGTPTFLLAGAAAIALLGTVLAVAVARRLR